MERYVWLFSGFGVGVGVAMLFAPKTGSETRAEIARKMQEGQDLLNQRTANMRQTVNDTLQRGSDMMNRVRSAVDAGKRELMREYPATV